MSSLWGFLAIEGSQGLDTIVGHSASQWHG
jgi:hypothetical protein